MKLVSGRAGDLASHWEIRPAGDSTLVVELQPRIDPRINARAIAIATAIRDACRPGILDIVPTYRSVVVYFDPYRNRARLD